MPAIQTSLNVFAAAGICASLALLGWEINTRDRPDARYLSITVMGSHNSDSDSDSDDDAVPSPEDNQHKDGLDDRNWYPNGRGAPGDGDDYHDGPAPHSDPDDVTPI